MAPKTRAYVAIVGASVGASPWLAAAVTLAVAAAATSAIFYYLRARAFIVVWCWRDEEEELLQGRDALDLPRSC